MEKLTPEKITEIRCEVFNSQNPRAKAEELAKEYSPSAVGDALQIANTNALPTNNFNAINNINSIKSDRKKPGPKPGTKRKKAKAETAAKADPEENMDTDKPERRQTNQNGVFLCAEYAAIVGAYLKARLRSDISRGLGGDWTLNDLRILLYAQHLMETCAIEAADQMMLTEGQSDA